MSGIAGTSRPGSRELVEAMLSSMAHRGPAGSELLQAPGGTLGIAAVGSQAHALPALTRDLAARDGSGDGCLAEAWLAPSGMTLRRDELGVAPLYYGYAEDGALCFASEVKALLAATRDVREFPPGHIFEDGGLRPYFHLAAQPPLGDPAENVARELRGRLEASVQRRLGSGEVGCWLSGGLDSSTMAALARPNVNALHTFAAGVQDAPDLHYARLVADFIGAKHHEAVVDFDAMLRALPDVIYHLESFDALLVRSSITNYAVARLAADYVPAAFSGEGGDELFAGYDYLKALEPAGLPDELIDITGRLHNTALQRVDRSAAAHGIVAHVGFLDPEVVDYALRIPPGFKLRGGVEKWILRRAMDGALPEQVLNRPKAKFWEGAGVGDLMAGYADEHITYSAFARERLLPNGWTLNSKEELLYYRVFREYFDVGDLSWMGRTKGAPVQS